MILGAGIIQVPIIERCKKLGYTTYVLDYLGDAPGMVIADYAFITSTLEIGLGKNDIINNIINLKK